MPKYHISPKTGFPAPCNATVKECPVGGLHFDNLTVAQEKLVNRLEEEHKDVLAGVSKTKNENQDELKQAIERNLINVKKDAPIGKKPDNIPDFNKYSKDEMPAVLDGVKDHVNKDTYGEVPYLIDAIASSKHKAILKTKVNGIVRKASNMVDRSNQEAFHNEVNLVLIKHSISLDGESMKSKNSLLPTRDRKQINRANNGNPTGKIINTRNQKPAALQNKNKSTPNVSERALATNQIRDYRPLNEDNALTRKYLEELQKYEEPGGFLGRKSRKSKFIENLVHNQIVIARGRNGFNFEKISAENYSAQVNKRIASSKNIYDDHTQYLSNKEKNELSNKLEEYIDSYEKNQEREKNIHDVFVEETKISLIAKVSELGWDHNPIVAKIAKASTASEIRSFTKSVNKLTKFDPYKELMEQK